VIPTTQCLFRQALLKPERRGASTSAGRKGAGEESGQFPAQLVLNARAGVERAVACDAIEDGAMLEKSRRPSCRTPRARAGGVHALVIDLQARFDHP
jgi:hypothetical protein